MSKALKETLEELHGQLAETLLAEVKNSEADPKGRAAVLNVARQFLKDNGIESLPGANKTVSSLAAVLPFPEPGEDAFKVG